MSDEAKAVEAVAKATTKALETLEKSGGFFNDVFGDAIRHYGGAFSDKALAFRIRNRASTAIKLAASLEERGLDHGFLTPEERAIFPAVEGLSMESDDSLQNLWAAYIANAVDPAKADVSLNRVVTDVLTKLEPADVLLLDYLFKSDLMDAREKTKYIRGGEIGVDGALLTTSLTRLASLGLFSFSNETSVFLVESPNDTVSYPCNFTIETHIGNFGATSLLGLFRDCVSD